MAFQWMGFTRAIRGSGKHENSLNSQMNQRMEWIGTAPDLAIQTNGEAESLSTF